jgi:hypothetical protein
MMNGVVCWSGVVVQEKRIYGCRENGKGWVGKNPAVQGFLRPWCCGGWSKVALVVQQGLAVVEWGYRIMVGEVL